MLALCVVEAGVRVLWTRLVQPAEQPLLSGDPLGPALVQESLGFRDWVQRVPAEGLYAPDPARGIRLQPNREVERSVTDGGGARTFTVRTDRYGLRGLDREPPPEGALVVLVVGDSMTFGEGVEDLESYPARLEDLLGSALAPRGVRVHNAGIVSYGQHEELACVRELVPRLRPDLVVLQFTVANDALDDQRWLAETPLRIDPEGAAALATHPFLDNPLASVSRTYRLLAWRWGRHAVRYRFMLEDEPLDRAAGLIGEARAACRDAAGSPLPFLVLVAPTSAQVEGSLLERALGTVEINHGIAARLSAAEIPVVDPLEALRGHHAAGEQLYIPVDRHWTAEGHQRVAEALAPAVRALVE
jgi:lysophospholipase L1-like esterase